MYFRWSMVLAVSVVWCAAATAQTNVAVVNIPIISEKYQKTAQLEARIQQQNKEFQRKREEMREAVERSAKVLREDFKQGTPEFAQREREVANMQWELQYYADSESKRIERDMAASMLSVYDDIRAMVAVVAKQRGIDLVMAADPDPELAPESTGQVRQQIVLQKVVFYKPELDITNEVVDRLNAQYSAQNAGGGKAAPPSDDSSQQ